MADIFDYLYWRGDIPFKTRRFNPLDNIVFSLISYLKFDNIVLCDYKKPYITLQEAYQEMEKRFYNDPYYFNDPIGLTEYQHDFIKAVARSERYKDTRLAGYVSLFDAGRELQFSAITFFPRGAPAYIAFRGTDSSLVGWKEDFNMALEKPIPAQAEAKNYLAEAAAHISRFSRIRNFYAGGHSKGGNLAIYAAAQAPRKIQKRIIKIYNNDGPGFTKAFLQSEGYCAVRDKIEAYLPSGSLFGLLFEHDYKLNIVKSSAQGLAQHTPYTWQIVPDDFEDAKKFNKNSIQLNKKIMNWIYSMDINQREQLIEKLYTSVNEAKDFYERVKGIFKGGFNDKV